MLVLEAINSFVAIFLFSELFVLKKNVASILRRKNNVVLLVLAIALNIFFSFLLPLRTSSFKIFFAFENQIHYVLFKYIGLRCSVSLFSFFFSLSIQYTYELSKSRGREKFAEDNTKATGYKRHLSIYWKSLIVAAISFVGMSIHEHKGGDRYLKFMVNFCLVSLMFSFGAYYDVRQEVSSLTTAVFFSTVWDGIRWLLPVFPVLMVAFSTIFFAVICFLDFFGMKKYEHYLNYPIYLGTLYGPTAFLYVYVKKQLLMSKKGLLH